MATSLIGTLTILQGSGVSNTFSTAGYTKFALVVPVGLDGSWLIGRVSVDGQAFVELQGDIAYPTNQPDVGAALNPGYAAFPYLQLALKNDAWQDAAQAADRAIAFVATP